MDGMTGTIDGGVYYYNHRLKKHMMREYVVPRPSSANARLKAVMKNLAAIQPSAAYKQNFKDYLMAYNDLKEYREHPVPGWNNLYMKMLFKMQKHLAGIDLATLTRAEIYAQDLPCKTLAAAIQAGLLPEVWNYARFNALI